MNNQVWPKDLSAPLRQVERAVIDLIFWNELDDRDKPVRQNAAHSGVGCELFELAHESGNASAHDLKSAPTIGLRSPVLQPIYPKSRALA